MHVTFDYIILGAGSAGCVLANRLSQDPHCRVLLLEAGGGDWHPTMKVPLSWYKAMQRPNADWGYVSEPMPSADMRSIPLPRGRVLGGCSSINAMLYSRGHREDYESWSRDGLADWGFDAVLPYFKRLEADWRGEGPFHGGDGPIPVSRQAPYGHAYSPLIQTAERLGYGQVDDFHGATQEGFGVPDFTVRRGRRGSTATCYLRPARRRSNLRVRVRARATRLLIEHRRVIGVEYLCGQQVRRAHAAREVLLSAGAFNSPHLLLSSGIGPADELRALGVKPILDLQGVGRNLQDHPTIAGVYRASQAATFISELRLDRIALSLLQWRISGTGPAAGLPISAQGLIKTREDLDRPDLQMIINPVSALARVWFPGWRKMPDHVFSIANQLLHPESRGWVCLRSSDPLAPPRIQLNLLQAEADRNALRRIVGFMRDFFRTEPAASLVTAEYSPGADVVTASDIDRYVRSAVGAGAHPTGTCAMGVGPDAVVDAELKVHGIERLRVIDASVMPTIIGGNTNAPTIMIAERASDLISGRRQAGAPA